MSVYNDKNKPLVLGMSREQRQDTNIILEPAENYFVQKIINLDFFPPMFVAPGVLLLEWYIMGLHG